jgi:hypothetical protein
VSFFLHRARLVQDAAAVAVAIRYGNVLFTSFLFEGLE